MKRIIRISMLLAVSGCGNIYSPLNSPVQQPSPPHVKPTYSVDDFEDQNTTNDRGGTNAVYCDPFGSSISVDYTAPGSTLAGGTPGSAMRLTGTMLKNVAPNYPYCLVQLDLNPGGPAMDIGTIAPTKRLTLAYKAGAASVGKAHRVTILENPQPRYTGDYGWYIYVITPLDTSWHQISINFQPPTPPYFTQSYGTPVPWSFAQTHACAVTVMPFSGPGANMPYDITFDDMRFE